MNQKVAVIGTGRYDSTMQLLRRPEIEPALRGKILVQLSGGTPDEAREMQSWARPLGIEYLDGAIMSYPVGIGKPEGTVWPQGGHRLVQSVLVDQSIADPQLLLIEKAVAASKGQADFTYLYEVLKKSSARSSCSRVTREELDNG